jgi:hypothetical protein
MRQNGDPPMTPDDSWQEPDGAEADKDDEAA